MVNIKETGFEIEFWRTKSGLEVDFILGGGEVAVEIKGARQVSGRDLYPILEFKKEFSPRKTIIVCNEGFERISRGIVIMPYRDFLSRLWKGEIIR